MARQPLYTPEERALQGNPGQRKLAKPDEMSDALPDVVTSVPPAPDWLTGAGDDAHYHMQDVGAMAVAAWDTLAAILVEARTFRAGDEMSLSRYCRMVAEWVTATFAIDRDGMVITVETEKSSREEVNPMLKARSMLEGHIQSLEKELGLSPAARLNVQRKLMAAIRDAPLPGKQTGKKGAQGRALGFLQDGDDDLGPV